MSKPYDKLVYELASRGLNNYQISDIVGVDEATVRRALKRTEFAKHLVPVELENWFDFTLDSPITIRDTDLMVTADWHIPITNMVLVNEMIEKARELKINRLLIAGDWFNFDALSSYDPKQDEAGMEREVQTSKMVMRVLNENFEHIYFTWGNHDARLHRALGWRMQFASAMRLMFEDLGAQFQKKLTISNLDHFLIEFSEAAEHRQRWRVCHPATYSRVPLSTPRTLAAKYNSNVICAHAHHAAVGFATDGIKTVAEIGGLFNQNATAYLQRSTTYPTWTPGYGWFKDGRFHLTTPYWST